MLWTGQWKVDLINGKVWKDHGQTKVADISKPAHKSFGDRKAKFFGDLYTSECPDLVITRLRESDVTTHPLHQHETFN